MIRLIALIFLGLLFMPVPGICLENALFAPSAFKIGYQGMQMYYDEPGLMEEKGMLHGGVLSWTGYSGKRLFMVGGELELLKGGMDYDGQYSDGTKLTCNTDDRYLDLRFLAGKGMGFGSWALTAYAGLAGRYWFDRIKAVGGYEREIKQAYLPLGIRIRHLSGRWSLGGSLEGNLLIYGRVESALSQVGPQYGDADNIQEFMSGLGGRISAFAEYRVGGYILGLEPYYRYWQVRESKIDTIPYGGRRAEVVEPENRSHMTGIRFYIRF